MCLQFESSKIWLKIKCSETTFHGEMHQYLEWFARKVVQAETLNIFANGLDKQWEDQA